MPTALVVDDERGTLEAIQYLLEARGVSCWTATSGSFSVTSTWATTSTRPRWRWRSVKGWMLRDDEREFRYCCLEGSGAAGLSRIGRIGCQPGEMMARSMSHRPGGWLMLPVSCLRCCGPGLARAGRSGTSSRASTPDRVVWHTDLSG